MASEQNPYSAPVALQRAADLKNPLLTIWFRPRETIRNIVLADPRKHVVLLSSLAGVTTTLKWMSRGNLGNSLSFVTMVAFAVLAGPVVGLIRLWVGTYLLDLIGEWMYGKAERSHLRAAIAWGHMPDVFQLLAWIPMLIVFGLANFTALKTGSLLAALMLIACHIARLVLSIWCLFTVSNTIAEVEGYPSAWRAFWIWLIAGILLTTTILPFALVYFLNGFR